VYVRWLRDLLILPLHLAINVSVDDFHGVPSWDLAKCPAIISSVVVSIPEKKL
jgi:hypothetical protein